MSLQAAGPGEVKAGDIDSGSDIEIMNPNLVLCHLDKGAKLSMELTVETGKGCGSNPKYSRRQPIGLIPIDAVFSGNKVS